MSNNSFKEYEGIRVIINNKHMQAKLWVDKCFQRFLSIDYFTFKNRLFYFFFIVKNNTNIIKPFSGNKIMHYILGKANYI